MGKLKDQTGHVYGKWTVLRKAEEKTAYGDVCWICRCECGNEKAVSGKILRKGKSKSCGQCTRHIMKPGERFGKLITIEDTGKTDSSRHKLWRCICDCGNEIIVASRNLTTGNTKSCGCNHQRHQLLGQKFGMLMVIEDMGNDIKGNSLWKCKCDCGREKIVRGVNLVAGATISCGCSKMSKGELKIKQILDSHKIKYKQEYLIREIGNKRFDFAILDNNNKVIKLIEFDGIQHYEDTGFSKLNKGESLQKRQESDRIKNEWAAAHNIPLLRIPYWDYNKIDFDMLQLQ